MSEEERLGAGGSAAAAGGAADPAFAQGPLGAGPVRDAGALLALIGPQAGAAPSAFDLTEAEAALRSVIEPDFDPCYYLLTNPDVCEAAIDPLCHYLRSGRLEGRKPALWFDPAFYRAAHPEVDASGQDPFAYYLQTGRPQGHATRRRSGAARRALDAARPPSARTGAVSQDTILHLHAGVLLAGLRQRLPATRGLTVSISHDRYAQSVGGIQVLVASEQAALNARGEAYLHLAPAVPLMTLGSDGSAPHYLHLTMDGAYLGAATDAELLDALAALGPDLPPVRRLVIHCLLGHRVSFVSALHEALHTAQDGPPAAVFWLHDYETVCIGYNLLRNDVSFCDAPPPDSPACGVCVYGDERPAHLAAIRALFGAIPFHVAAPSNAALALWQRKARLPHLSASVPDVLRLDRTATRRRMAGAPERGRPGNPVRIGFAGLPVVSKGWEEFRRIAEELQRSGVYRLLHFSAGEDQNLQGVRHVPVRVCASAPDAMTSAFAGQGVDLVLILSPWPETFCIVASEALAGGADVLALENSGNVANLVRQTGRGRVFATPDDILAYLASPQALLDVRARHDAGAEVGHVRLLGATAALALPDGAKAAAAPAGTA